MRRKYKNWVLGWGGGEGKGGGEQGDKTKGKSDLFWTAKGILQSEGGEEKTTEKMFGIQGDRAQIEGGKTAGQKLNGFGGRPTKMGRGGEEVNI